jgi:hypothetical protein
MSAKRIAEITLREDRTEGDVSILTAYVKETGELVLEGYDIGKTAERYWGREEYEYWRIVAPENVPQVLLQLLKERFKTDTEFHDWLTERGIPSDFTTLGYE